MYNFLQEKKKSGATKAFMYVAIFTNKIISITLNSSLPLKLL